MTLVKERIRCTTRNSQPQKDATDGNWKNIKELREKQRNTPIVEKWVHNTSKHELSPTERRTLSTGLNLAITPKNIPHKEFIPANELECEKIPDQGQKSSCILKTARPPPSNIIEKEAIKATAKKTRTSQFSRQDSQIVQNQLQTDRTLKKATKLLTIQDITQLLQFITTSTYFQLLLVFGVRDGETLLDTHTVASSTTTTPTNFLKPTPTTRNLLN